jgi:hypothetical protein
MAREEDTMATKILGSITTYVGSEIPGLNGLRVRILAVLRGALRPDHDPDSDDSFVNDEQELERLGGVTADDRLDVQPIFPDGRQSFVHVDPRAIDLECFKHLAKQPAAKKTGKRGAKR